MAWFWLFIAGILEVVWAVGMKYSHGLTRPLPSLWTIAASIGSFVLLAQAIRTLPVGTGYAVWTGIGAVGAAAMGMILFNESISPARLTCMALIVAGVVGLKLVERPLPPSPAAEVSVDR